METYVIALPEGRVNNIKSWAVMGERFDLLDRYQVINTLGEQSALCAAKDTNSDRVVAIKKMKNIFESVDVAKRTLRTLRLLRLLNHDNIVRILDVLQPFAIGLSKFSEIYVVYEVMDLDLHAITQSGQNFTDVHLQYLTLQILRALEYLHSHQVVHGNLTPKNLLLNANCKLKMTGFGEARVVNVVKDPSNRVKMSECDETCYYRAPELLIGLHLKGWETYGFAIDTWAVGCIMGEIISTKPLFKSSDLEGQIEKQCRMIGKPDDDFIVRTSDAGYRNLFNRLPVTSQSFDFKRFWPMANPVAIDLMKMFLKFDPSHRISAAGALCHPYLLSLLSVSTSPEKPTKAFATASVLAEEMRFELSESIDLLRVEVVRECRKYHPDDWWLSVADEKKEEEEAAEAALIVTADEKAKSELLTAPATTAAAAATAAAAVTAQDSDSRASSSVGTADTDSPTAKAQSKCALV